MNWFPEDAPVRSRVIHSWKLPIHLVEKNPEDAPAVLFLHGNPTWSYLYRHLIDPVSEKGYHVIAPDLPGFGRSGKWTDPSAYSFSRHVESVEHVLESYGNSDLILVGHDWGGPIGLHIVCSDPERFSRVILINTGTFFQVDLPLYFRLMMAPGIGEFFFGRLNGFVEGGLRAGCTQRQKLRPEVMRHYRRPFRDPNSRAGIIAFPRMIPADPSHRYRDRFRALERKAGNLDVPVAIISGRDDPVFGPSYGQRMEQLFPRGIHRVVENGSHYLQEDQPGRLQKLIIGFLESSGYGSG